MHCMPSQAIAALILFIGVCASPAAFAQPSGLLASEQAPAPAEHPYTAQAAQRAVNETSQESSVLASEQGLETLDSERARARVEARNMPRRTQAPQPLASDSPAEATGQ